MWEKVDVVFKLKSPLHIGYMPSKGSVVSPTRYYVPGRNLWGAITKRVTEYLCEKPEADDYKKIGRHVMENFRFSYFYLYDGRTIYLPRYRDEGLKYGGDGGEITESEFERRFIGSRISTAINSDGTAKDESLHEIEFINNIFKDENGDIKDVKIAGCIWVKENAKIDGKEVSINDRDKEIFIEDFNIIQEFILGGESKYGFGHIALESVNKIDFLNLAPFKWDNPEEIKIESDELMVSHFKYDKNIRFEGNIELLTGRGYFDPKRDRNGNNRENKDSKTPGGTIYIPEYYFSPGSVVREPRIAKLNWDGTMEVGSNETN